ncbi:MAG: SDR family NAD(P)-dependent oxidoreductase, partial [Pseudomonadota bacterium]|nr:SDR family NAD(P)-dependent oxidoreductase [Pseudomonadota bacterium]
MLEAIVADRALLARVPRDERTRLLQAAGQASRPDAVDRRRLVKAARRERKADRVQRDQQVLDTTSMRAMRRASVFLTPQSFPPVAPDQLEQLDSLGEVGALEDGGEPLDDREVIEPRTCYICKQGYSVVHHFYDQLCPPCAELNYAKRGELADLRGRVALLTGGRVKIGYQAGIKLLRAGVHLIVTTRFPRDAAERYAREPDFPEWGDRLEIFGLDLRHTPSVEAFCAHLLSTRDRLDFIVNNACQTVRRPPDFYRHMMAAELGALDALSAPARRLLGAYEGLRGYHMLPEA